jgi:hypothetical protein
LLHYKNFSDVNLIFVAQCKNYYIEHISVTKRELLFIYQNSSIVFSISNNSNLFSFCNRLLFYLTKVESLPNSLAFNSVLACSNY